MKTAEERACEIIHDYLLALHENGIDIDYPSDLLVAITKAIKSYNYDFMEILFPGVAIEDVNCP